MKAKLTLCLVLSLFVWGLNPLYANARAAISVNTTQDEFNTDGDCSLREAIRAANADTAVDACPAGSGADTISLPPGTYILSITGPNEDLNLSGDLDITAPLTLNGHTAVDTVIDANHLDRVLQVMSGTTVTLANLTLRNGKVLDQTIHNNGGGIYNGGTLTLDQVIVSGNQASQSSDVIAKQPQGGGIYNSATLILTRTLLHNNSSSHTTAWTDAGQGGGLYNASGASATVTDTTISGNSAANIKPMQQNGSGGGIYNDSATLIMERTTIDHNIAGGSCPAMGYGGGIYNINGTVTLTNVTLSNNQAPGGMSLGGGLYNKGATSNPTLTNVTLYANVAGNLGGNIYNTFGATPIKVRNTIIAHPTGLGYDNCAGGVENNPATRINDLGHNLEYPTAVATSRSCGLNVADPKLLDLALNAPGETQTHALQTGSAALDVIGACGGAPATDQRGIARPQGTSCDLGAYEKGGEPPLMKVFLPSVKR